MKNTLYQIAILLCLLTATVSCKKEIEKKITTSTTEVAIKKNELYKRSMGELCPECGLSISQQAKHSAVSEIKLDTIIQSFKFIYLYKPVIDYTGTDEVEIKTSSGSNGESENTLIHYETIKFTITD